MILAIVGMGVLVPLAAVFVRRQPEDMGLLPDGDTGLDSAERAVSDEFSWAVSEAIRTTTLWRLVIVFGASSLAASTIDLHRIPAFMDRGLDPAHVAFATAPCARDRRPSLSGCWSGIFPPVYLVQLISGCWRLQAS